MSKICPVKSFQTARESRRPQSPGLKLTQLAFALTFALGSSAAVAAGLGQLVVQSGLGQPLRAEIELTAVAAGELETLVARLAAPADFTRSRLEYPRIASVLRFTVERRNGRDLLMLTTLQPVNEPFLDLLVELSGSGGRLVRSYTLLLDPPELSMAPRPLSAAPLAAATAPPSAALPPPPPRPPQAAQARPAPAAPPPDGRLRPGASGALPPRSSPDMPAAPPGRSDTYRVQRGESLSTIARNVQAPGATLEQMLLALFRSNESAFDGGNMNRLRAGAILRVPDAQTVNQVPAAEARRIYQAQAADFQTYRRDVAGAVGTTRTEPAAPGTQAAGGRITARVDDKSAAAPTGDQLKLSQPAAPPPATKAGTVPGKAAPASTVSAASAEDLALKDRALKEANDRVALLEKTVSELRTLVEMTNQSLAALQKQAGMVPTPGSGSAVVAAGTPAAPASVGTAAPGAGPGASAGVAVPDAMAPTPPAMEPSAAPPAVVPPVATPTSQPASQMDNSLMGSINRALGHPMAWPIIGGLLALLVALVMLARRRRSRPLDDDDNEESAAANVGANSMFGASGGASVDTSNSSFNSNFVPQASTGAVGDVNEVDPVAEADVYIAYGRDAQAEEILREALRNQPDRAPVRMKLLELYAKRKDAKSFESDAKELFARTSGQGPDWAATAELGRSLDPTNKLYAEAGSNDLDMSATTVTARMAAPVVAVAAAVAPPPPVQAQPAAPEPLLDIDLTRTDPHPAPASNVPPQDVSAGLDLDFDLGLDTTPTAALAPEKNASAGNDGSGLDFNLDLSSAPSISETIPPAASEDAGNVIDFEFDMSEPAGKKEEAGGAPPMAPVDSTFGGLSLDLDPAEAHSESSVPGDEMSTKLDLAVAYRDIGDLDGARELLEEVTRGGDEAQVAKAKDILATLG